MEKEQLKVHREIKESKLTYVIAKNSQTGLDYDIPERDRLCEYKEYQFSIPKENNNPSGGRERVYEFIEVSTKKTIGLSDYGIKRWLTDKEAAAILI